MADQSTPKAFYTNKTPRLSLFSESTASNTKVFATRNGGLTNRKALVSTLWSGSASTIAKKKLATYKKWADEELDAPFPERSSCGANHGADTEKSGNDSAPADDALENFVDRKMNIIEDVSSDTSFLTSEEEDYITSLKFDSDDTNMLNIHEKELAFDTAILNRRFSIEMDIERKKKHVTHDAFGCIDPYYLKKLKEKEDRDVEVSTGLAMVLSCILKRCTDLDIQHIFGKSSIDCLSIYSIVGYLQGYFGGSSWRTLALTLQPADISENPFDDPPLLPLTRDYRYLDEPELEQNSFKLTELTLHRARVRAPWHAPHSFDEQEETSSTLEDYSWDEEEKSENTSPVHVEYWD